MKPIPGFPGYYADIDGGVYSTRRGCARRLRPVMHNGFPHVWVLAGYGNDTVRKIPVRVLILRAYVGPRPARHVCRHLNGDSTDNRLANLRWGTIMRTRWTRCGMAPLRACGVVRIIPLRFCGMTMCAPFAASSVAARAALRLRSGSIFRSGR